MNRVAQRAAWSPASLNASRAISFGHALELVEHAAGLHHGDPLFDAPLPLPMRVSSGFLRDAACRGRRGCSSLPARLVARWIAIRAASIWREVSQPRLERLQAEVAEATRRCRGTKGPCGSCPSAACGTWFVSGIKHGEIPLQRSARALRLAGDPGGGAAEAPRP